MSSIDFEMASEQLLGAAYRLKGENLHVLVDDIESHLSNASAGLARSNIDVVLYDANLNDKVRPKNTTLKGQSFFSYAFCYSKVMHSLSLAKSGLADFRLQASQASRQDRVLSQSISAEYEKTLERLEKEQQAAEERSRAGDSLPHLLCSRLIYATCMSTINLPCLLCSWNNWRG